MPILKQQRPLVGFHCIGPDVHTEEGEGESTKKKKGER